MKEAKFKVGDLVKYESHKSGIVLAICTNLCPRSNGTAQKMSVLVLSNGNQPALPHMPQVGKTAVILEDIRISEWKLA